MPFIKIHVPIGLDHLTHQIILRELRKNLVSILGIREDHGHLVIYESPLTAREVHKNRDKNFVFVEIQMFSGRSDEIKEALFLKITEIIKKNIKINENNILINIIETERKNWGGRGGIPLSKLNLGY
ncbi:MAG: DUF1904 family protein [Candidatus Lokiarchaeota archaeon]|nr:DUF1904 family protein [Candidatus Lokiarchaeota archaeon]